MAVDKCKERLAKMPLDQLVNRWKRKKGSPFKEEKPTKYKWREIGSPTFKEIADMKRSDIRSNTGEVIDEAIQLAKVGVTGLAILIPSLEDVQEDFAKTESTDIKPKIEQKKTIVPRRKDSKLDHLDFILHSSYVHGAEEVFPEKVDIVLQPMTVGLEPLKPPLPKDKDSGNVVIEEPDAHAFPLQYRSDGTSRYLLRHVPERGHPIRYGGLRDHVDVNSVKLGISSYHMTQTKDGFSRKVDGAFFGI